MMATGPEEFRDTRPAQDSETLELRPSGKCAGDTPEAVYKIYG